jgi:AcrR family transcriptional regulator
LNQTVHWRMPESQARGRLLAGVVEYALSAGIADLSLREIAAAAGTSHRMLIYHFGSREGLLREVAKAVEEAQRARLASLWDSDPAVFWREIRDAGLWPQERLFFELYSHALRHRPGTEGFLDGIVDSWVTPVADRLTELGWQGRDARTDARLSVAVVRGLLLDLLATGETEEVDRAYDRFVSAVYEPGPPRPPVTTRKQDAG